MKKKIILIIIGIALSLLMLNCKKDYRDKWCGKYEFTVYGQETSLQYTDTNSYYLVLMDTMKYVGSVNPLDDEQLLIKYSIYELKVFVDEQGTLFYRKDYPAKSGYFTGEDALYLLNHLKTPLAYSAQHEIYANKIK